jgi:probable rRNA maturation factor
LKQHTAAANLPQAGSGRTRNSRKMARSAHPMTEVLVTANCWQDEPGAETVIHRAVGAAAEMADADTGDAELAVMLTDDAGIRTLNQNWRGIDKATNVLSFPASGQAVGEVGLLGDIVIAYETLERECDDENRIFLHHLAHLTVHGFLHLTGYDHQTDVQAEEMEGLESRIMTCLNLPDPYLSRDFGDA